MVQWLYHTAMDTGLDTRLEIIDDGKPEFSESHTSIYSIAYKIMYQIFQKEYPCDCRLATMKRTELYFSESTPKGNSTQIEIPPPTIGVDKNKQV